METTDEKNELPVNEVQPLALIEEGSLGHDQGGEERPVNQGNIGSNEVVEVAESVEEGQDKDPVGVDRPKNLGGRPKGKGDSKPRTRRTRAQIKADENKDPKQVPAEATDEAPEPETDGKAEFEDFVNSATEDQGPEIKAEEAKGEQAKPQQPPPVKPMISGYLLLIVIDTIAPSVVITVVGWAMKSARDITAAEIRLTKAQLESLTPLADQVAEIVFSNMHPINALFISMAFMYTGNLMAITNARPKKIHLNEQKPDKDGNKKD